jgi:hypothetical protein
MISVMLGMLMAEVSGQWAEEVAKVLRAPWIRMRRQIFEAGSRDGDAAGKQRLAAHT